MEPLLIVSLIVAVLVLLYLVVALINPEIFP